MWAYNVLLCIIQLFNRILFWITLKSWSRCKSAILLCRGLQTRDCYAAKKSFPSQTTIIIPLHHCVVPKLCCAQGCSIVSTAQWPRSLCSRISAAGYLPRVFCAQYILGITWQWDRMLITTHSRRAFSKPQILHTGQDLERPVLVGSPFYPCK